MQEEKDKLNSLQEEKDKLISLREEKDKLKENFGSLSSSSDHEGCQTSQGYAGNWAGWKGKDSYLRQQNRKVYSWKGPKF